MLSQSSCVADGKTGEKAHWGHVDAVVHMLERQVERLERQRHPLVAVGLHLEPLSPALSYRAIL